MNIFACHPNPILSVIYIEYYKQFIAALKEAFQIAFTALHLLGVSLDAAPAGHPKPTQLTNKCMRWASASSANYRWLLDYAEALCNNYYAYTVEKNANDVKAGKPPSAVAKVRQHVYARFIPWLRANIPRFPSDEPTPFPQVIIDTELPRVVQRTPDGKIDIHATYREYMRMDVAIDRLKRRKEANDAQQSSPKRARF